MSACIVILFTASEAMQLSLCVSHTNYLNNSSIQLFNAVLMYHYTVLRIRCCKYARSLHL
jgi:hypothetical protein